MASILDKYGIKEVADVVFYEINDNGTHGKPVLYLDTLKVSTIEQTAEQAEARGGKGNPALIAWDNGKEITVTLEDALFSAKSMAIMFSGGSNVTQAPSSIWKTIVVDGERKNNLPATTMPDGTVITTPTNGTWYTAEGSTINANDLVSGTKYFYKYATTVNAKTIDISANSFPGTYYVMGDTYARSQQTGKDEFFQFIIQKAKVQSENTITLEAEGDPSTFSMNLKVLRPDDGKMMKLVQYSIDGAVEGFITDSKILLAKGTHEVTFTIPFAKESTTGTLGYKVDGTAPTGGATHVNNISFAYANDEATIKVNASDTATSAGAYRIDVIDTTNDNRVVDYIIVNVESAS